MFRVLFECHQFHTKASSERWRQNLKVDFHDKPLWQRARRLETIDSDEGNGRFSALTRQKSEAISRLW